MSKLKLFFLLLFVPALAPAQENGNKQDVVSVEETPVETRVKVPGATIVVNHSGDTVTKIHLRNRRLEFIDNDGKTAKIRMVHTPRKKFEGHWGGFELGLNNFFSSPFNSELPPEAAYLDLNAGKSVVVGINLFEHSIGIQKNKNNIGLVTGLGITFNNYRFDSPYLLTRMDNGHTGYTESPRHVNKYKLATTFLTVPLLLEFQIPDGSHRPFYISAGAYGGLKIGSHTKVKYADNIGMRKVKSRKDINLNSFKYGLTVRAGFRRINLFATCDMSRLFQKGQAPDIYPWSAGITLVNF